MSPVGVVPIVRNAYGRRWSNRFYLSPGDLDELKRVIDGLRDAQLEAWNAQRRGDQAALAAGITQLAEAVHEAVFDLKSLSNR